MLTELRTSSIPTSPHSWTSEPSAFAHMVFPGIFIHFFFLCFIICPREDIPLHCWALWIWRSVSLPRTRKIWAVISLNRLCVFPWGHPHCERLLAYWCLLYPCLVYFSSLHPSFPPTSLFQNPAFKFKSSFPSAWSHWLPVFSNILLTLLIRIFTPPKWKSQRSLVLCLHLCSDQNCFTNLAAVPVCICWISQSISRGTIILKSFF